MFCGTHLRRAMDAQMKVRSRITDTSQRSSLVSGRRVASREVNGMSGERRGSVGQGSFALVSPTTSDQLGSRVL